MVQRLRSAARKTQSPSGAEVRSMRHPGFFEYCFVYFPMNCFSDSPRKRAAARHSASLAHTSPAAVRCGVHMTSWWGGGERPFQAPLEHVDKYSSRT